jgi:protein-disulfide isomerase
MKQERQKREKRERLITIAVISFIAVVFAGALILSQLGNRGGGLGEIIVPEGLTRAQANANTAGDPNAPVVVEEFSDFQCSHCLTFWRESEARLLNDYVNAGKVYFKYTSFPVISPESGPIAQAAYCAMDQGMFWEYHDLLFANYELGFARTRLDGYAEHLKLDLNTFEECLDSGKYAQAIEDDANRAQAAGVTGTPTFLVNGQLANRVDLFDKIDQALAGQ